MSTKVVLIDDKPLILEAIRLSVNWEACDCEVVGQAHDGSAGIELIKETKPDIIVTDIRMPGCDGLQLAQVAKAMNPEVRIVIITGYQEFEYAQKALKIGVFDFVLKPISYPELNTIIRRASEEIQRGRRMLRDSRMESAGRMPDLRSKLFSDWLMLITEDAETMEINLRKVELQIDASFILVLFRPQVAAPLHRDLDAFQSKMRSFMDSADGIIGGLSVLQELDVVPVALYTDYLFLFIEKNSQRETKLAASVEVFVERIVSANDKMPLLASASGMYPNLLRLREAYVEASEQLDGSFFNSPDGETTENREPASDPIEWLEQIPVVLDRHSQEELEAHLKALFRRIELFSDGNVFIAKSLIAEACLISIRHDHKRSGSRDGSGRPIEEAMERIEKMTNMREAEDYVRELIRGIQLRRLPEEGEEKYSPIVKSVLQYIDGHYMENLSLSGTAHKFNINASYLSRIVAQQTGTGFVDILANIRIRHAKRLLREGNHLIKDVGSAVGYKDYAYFYMVFKRTEGISPREYQQQL